MRRYGPTTRPAGGIEENRFVLEPLVTVIAAGPTERTYALYALMACAIVLLTISVHRRRREGFGNLPKNPPRKERNDDFVARQAIKDDMQALLVELQDLSRKINAQIDTRFAKLEAAIADADRRIEALQRLSRAARGEPVVDVTIGNEAPGGSPPDPPPASAAPAHPPIRHAAVYDLADTGKSPVEIAQALGRTPGEIELILALRPRK